MEASEKAFELLREFEASNVCRLQAYLDTGDVPTIGWGTTHYPDGTAVKLGDTCTIEQANQWMANDVAGSVAAVNRFVTVTISQSMFDALVDFVYNEGERQFKTSTLLKLINQSQFSSAADQFPRWKFDNGVEEPGLVRRRAAEQKLFIQGIADLNSSSST